MKIYSDTLTSSEVRSAFSELSSDGVYLEMLGAWTRPEVTR